MKKLSLFLAAAVAAISFASCNKSEIESPQRDIEFDITVSSPYVEGTKAVKTSWTSGDKIFIWFEDSYADNPELTITYNGTKWEAGSLAAGVELNEEKGGSFKYVYLSTNTWSFSPGHLIGFTTFDFPNYSVSGTDPDVNRAESPMILCSNTENFIGCPTYTFVDGKLTMVLDAWKFLTNAQVTVPLKEGIDAKKLRLRCYKTGYFSGVGCQLQIFPSYYIMGTTDADYSVGKSATDGAVFYLSLADSWFTQSDNIKFQLIDVSSGSKVYYKYTTSTSKAFPLSNGADIKDVDPLQGGSKENVFSAVKLPVFNGEADSHWEATSTL